MAEEQPAKQRGSADNDIHKGAVEDDARESSHHHDETNSSLRGQLGHRNQDEMLKDNDSDFPEPGPNEEHTGEPGAGSERKKNPEGVTQDQDPGHRQKQNQNWRKEDPLAG